MMSCEESNERCVICGKIRKLLSERDEGLEAKFQDLVSTHSAFSRHATNTLKLHDFEQAKGEVERGLLAERVAELTRERHQRAAKERNDMLKAQIAGLKADYDEQKKRHSAFNEELEHELGVQKRHHKEELERRKDDNDLYPIQRK
jgi:hypothetical protein